MIENAFFLSFIMQRGTLKPINEVTKVRPIKPVYSYKSQVTHEFQAFWSRPPSIDPAVYWGVTAQCCRARRFTMRRDTAVLEGAAGLSLCTFISRECKVNMNTINP